MEKDVIKLLNNVILTLKEFHENLGDFDTLKFEIVDELSTLVSTVDHFISILENSYDELNEQEKEKFNRYSIPVMQELFDSLKLYLQNLAGKELIIELKKIEHSFNEIERNYYNIQAFSEAIKSFEQKSKEVLSKTEVINNTIQNVDVDEVYKEASEEYIIKAEVNEKKFYYVIGIATILTSLSIILDRLAPTDMLHIILMKVLILSISITLATLFIRKASNFRRLGEQAHQTHLELRAFPPFVATLNPEDQSFLRKELALKYFGKELDQTQNNKIGDLMKDQLTAGTELIKASAEMVKNAKSLGSSTDKVKNDKPNNTSTEDKTKSEGDR